ncbi:MAG: glycoside hydrolase family 3 protein [Planctomycetes bacterium]|jgi:beta-glucosidase|nr:glycoside hydrolase family 3 C-terminal domain-containing protein [Phycisphaerae bacterium]NBB94884.1 glycoside hydrolase family 3 protein [Planctomycetota bacterium]
MSDATEAPLFRDSSQPVKARVDDLLGRLSLDEKIAEMMNNAPGVERLDIKPYEWWNEALHGIGRAGKATVFPQAIGMAASWDADLMGRVATAIGNEGRAKYHAAQRKQNYRRYMGLTFWSPNINIFRDPRWGRGHETYGEDPYLTARMGVAFVRGLQGDDPKHLKLAACAKHYAVHSGPETKRHEIDIDVPRRELYETYLYAFAALVREAGVESVMGAYNRFRGEPCCGSTLLLQTILREQWGFDGHVVSDCGAISDVWLHHKLVDTPEEAVAMAIKNGCDLNCGQAYKHVRGAVNQKLLTEEEIDVALGRLLRTKMRLGMFDPPESVSHSSIPEDVLDCEEHRSLAREMARKSIVLLKNKDNLLPLPKDLTALLLVGPNIDDKHVLLGNYYGFNPRMSTIRDGIVGAISPGTTLEGKEFCPLFGEARKGSFDWMHEQAKAKDVVVAVMGLTPRLEGEEGDAEDSESGGDRRTIELPPVQQQFLEILGGLGRPVVLILTGGSQMAIPYAKEHLDAVMLCWYPGEEGGRAVADVLFGDVNPSGRLPLTFYSSTDDLPDFENYDMARRTYRYFDGEPLWPFGYGMSYTSFGYKSLDLPPKLAAGEDLVVSVEVTNTGDRAGEEVVQLYLLHDNRSADQPKRTLRRFTRVTLEPGEAQAITFTLSPRDLALINDDGQAELKPGNITVSLGGGQPEVETPSTTQVLAADIEITGETLTMDV